MEGQDTVNSKTEPIKVPRFIEISERTIDDDNNIPKPETGKVLLKYKNITLEFDGDSVTATPFCHKSDMLNCQCLI